MTNLNLNLSLVSFLKGYCRPGSSSFDVSAENESTDSKPWRSVGSEPLKFKGGSLGFAGLKLGASGAAPGAQGAVQRTAFGSTVVNEDDENAQDSSTSRKRLVPLEYSEEENRALLMDSVSPSQQTAMSAEDKRKAIKSLIEKIPTSKDELFAYSVNWSYVDAVSIIFYLK